MQNWGETLGISFSQFRHPKKPLLIGIENDNGFCLNGYSRWVTGYKIFDQLVLGFFLKNKKEVFSLIPFKAQENLSISKPMITLAMPSVQTVRINFDDYFVSKRKILMINEKNHFLKTNSTWTKQYSTFSGLTLAFLESIKISKRKDPYFSSQYEKLKKEYKDLRSTYLKIIETDEYSKIYHAQFMRLAHRSCQLAFSVVGPKGTLIDNPLQRLYRELMQFTMIGFHREININFLKSFMK